MRRYRAILFFALAASLASCGWIDPESIEDPVNETSQRIVKISVNSEPETKLNVNVVGKQGIITFTGSDKLFLFETNKYDTGFSSYTTTSLLTSLGAILKNGGKSADFTFMMSFDPSAPIPNEQIYVAAFGDWSLNGTTMEVNIPVSSNMTSNDEAGSVLPQKGVIAMSEAYSGTPVEAEKIFFSNVILHHLVSYGILNITGLPGKEITNIQIEKDSPIAGVATIQLSHTDNYSDISPTTGGKYLLSTLSIKSGSSKTISITPSSGVRDSIKFNKGTSIWLSSVSSTFSDEPIKVTLTDSDSNKYYGQYSSLSPITPGNTAVINISEWTPDSGL